MAMVQGAVYDAVNSIDGGHEAYLDGLPAADPAASIDAAVATAAHHVLVGLGIAPVPALPQVVRDRLDALYAESLAAITDGRPRTRHRRRRFRRGGDAGRTHRRRPVRAAFRSPRGPSLANGVRHSRNSSTTRIAWIMQVDPFVLEEPSQFQTQGPRPLASGAYAKEYDEVKELGAATPRWTVRATRSRRRSRSSTRQRQPR